MLPNPDNSCATDTQDRASSRTKIKRDKLLNVVDGQIIRLCKQRACALELKAGGQQVLAPPVVLSLGLGLQNCRAGTQLFPDGVDPSTETRHRLGGNRVNVNTGSPTSYRLSAAGRCLSRHLRMKALRRTLSFRRRPLGQHGLLLTGLVAASHK